MLGIVFDTRACAGGYSSVGSAPSLSRVLFSIPMVTRVCYAYWVGIVFNTRGYGWCIRFWLGIVFDTRDSVGTLFVLGIVFDTYGC